MFKSGEMPEAMLESEYRQYQSRERISNWVYTGLFFFTVHETSVVRPENYAATVADVLASRGTGGSTLNPWMTLGARSVVQDLRERIRFGLQPLAGFGAPQTTLTTIDALLPQPLPLRSCGASYSNASKPNLPRIASSPTSPNSKRSSKRRTRTPRSQR